MNPFWGICCVAGLEAVLAADWLVSCLVGSSGKPSSDAGLVASALSDSATAGVSCVDRPAADAGSRPERSVAVVALGESH